MKSSKKIADWLESAFIILFYFCSTITIYAILNVLIELLKGVLK